MGLPCSCKVKKCWKCNECSRCGCDHDVTTVAVKMARTKGRLHGSTKKEKRNQQSLRPVIQRNAKPVGSLKETAEHEGLTIETVEVPYLKD